MNSEVPIKTVRGIYGMSMRRVIPSLLFDNKEKKTDYIKFRD